MEQSTKIQTTNYKKEPFTKLENIQVRMEDVVKKIEVNFNKNKFILVKNIVSKTKLRELFKNTFGEPDDEGEYTGLYLFAEKKDNKYNCLYTGITRKAIMRINDHVRSNNKSSATWAYLIVKDSKKFYLRIKEFHHKSNLSKKQKDKKEDLKKDIKKEIVKIQEKCFSKLFVTFIPINDNFFLQMIEPYIACEFKCKWNSFETH